MKRCLLCYGVAAMVCSSLTAQYYFYDANHLEPEWRWETGMAMGLMNCLTDLGGHNGNGEKFIKDINWSQSKLCVGIFLLAMHHDVLGIRFEFTKGQVEAYDSILKNSSSAAYFRYRRNLQFRSSIMELCGLLEFHPLYIAQGATHSLSPYLLAGVGCFHFQPEANINGSWSMLRPLHTEGQGFREFPERREYQLQQINFPVGMGVRYEMSTYAIFRLECIYRLLKTDYLDDVSTTYIDPKIFDLYYSAEAAALAKTLADRTVELDPTHKTIPASLRGNPKNKDAYFSFNLKFSVVLNRKRK